MDLTYLSGEITKTERTSDGLIVDGKATGPDLDSDRQICDPAWLAKAMPEWMQWGNIREGHSPLAAGVGLDLTQAGDDWHVRSLCVDPGTQRKLETGVLKGYSIGIKGARVVKDAQAPGGRIVGGEIVEVSYVDRPANPTARVTVVKSAGGHLAPVDADGEPVEADLVKAALSAAQVNDLPDSAFAYIEPGGTKDDGGKTIPRSKRHFPLVDAAHVRNALARAPQSPFGAKAMPKIRAAARKFGVEVGKAVDAAVTAALLPDVAKADGDGWTHDPAVLAQVRDGLARLMQAELDEVMGGEDECYDLHQLLSALDLFLRWWSGEAAEGEDPPPFPGGDDMDSTLVTGLGVSPDLVKAAADNPDDADKRKALIDAVKALLADEPDTTKFVTSDTVKEVLAEALKGFGADLAEVKERLGTVETMAAPGLAARTRPPEAAAKAAAVERLQADRARYLLMAEQVTDQDLARGYRAKAAQIDRDLAVAP